MTADARVTITQDISLCLFWNRQEKLIVLLYDSVTERVIEMSLTSLKTVFNFVLNLNNLNELAGVSVEQILTSEKNAVGEKFLKCKYGYAYTGAIKKSFLIEETFKSRISTTAYSTPSYINFYGNREINALIACIPKIKKTLKQQLIFKENIIASYLSIQRAYDEYMISEKECFFYGSDTRIFQHFIQAHFTLNMFNSQINWNARHQVSSEEAEILYKYLLQPSRKDKLYAIFKFDYYQPYEVLKLYLEIQAEHGLKELRDILTYLN
jgi:hypothetical protein